MLRVCSGYSAGWLWERIDTAVQVLALVLFLRRSGTRGRLIKLISVRLPHVCTLNSLRANHG